MVGFPGVFVLLPELLQNHVVRVIVGLERKKEPNGKILAWQGTFTGNIRKPNVLGMRTIGFR